MQATDISRELDWAISSIENLLNGENGEDVLQAIKRYKESKRTVYNYSSIKLKVR